MLSVEIVVLGLLIVPVGIIATIMNFTWQLAQGTPLNQVRSPWAGPLGWVVAIGIVGIAAFAFSQSTP